METIKLTKQNEVYMWVDCSLSVQRELREHFSFYIPNWRFHPKVKAKLWDGKINLFQNNRLYIGLFFDLFSFAEERHYSIKILNKELKEKNLTPQELTQEDAKILDSIPFCYDSPRDYQMNAIIDAIKHKRRTIVSPTGCLDPSTTHINCIINKESSPTPKTLSFQELYDSFRDNKDSLIEVETPHGYHKVIEVYKKYGPGVSIQFSDGTYIKGSRNHLMKNIRGYFKFLDEFVVGEDILSFNNTNEIISVSNVMDLPSQEWIDFSVDHFDETYCLVDGTIHHNSGKSAIIYYLSLWFLQKEKRNVLIIVPSTNLVEQMAKDFVKYSNETLPEKDLLVKIYSGTQWLPPSDDLPNRIFISTWQSLYSIIKNNKDTASMMEQFGMICLDECHGIDARAIGTVIEKCINADYRFGTTGTIKDTKINEFQLKGCFGPINRTISTAELQDRKELASLDIECVILKYPEVIKKNFKKAVNTYQQEVDYILSLNKRRNEIISQLILNESSNSLVLFHQVENHGIPLYETLVSMNKDKSRKIFFISGKTHVEDREKIREIVEKEKNAVICATSSIMSTGVNIVNLGTILFAFSTKSQVKVIQSIGRALRVSDKKTSAKLIDIVDDLSWKSKKNYVLGHFLKRLEYYKEEQFRFSLKEIPFVPPQ